MKKYLFSAVAMLALVACNKESAPVSFSDGESALVNNEIAVNTAAQKTKGYITGTDFFDTAIAQLHEGTPETTAREMKLSAYLTPQSGDAGNYFVDFTFAKGADENWHHTPAVYWPIAGTLDFLAYSSATPFDAKDVVWNEKNASESVVLTVLEDHTQDDIVYASAYGKKSEDGADAVAMEFQHTQAWLEFQIKVANENMKEKIAIKEIVIEKVYNSGELTIAKGTTGAKAEWSFRREQSKDIVFEDNYNLYGSSEGGVLTNALDEEISYMDMLLPEQPKTSFVITYYLAGQDKELQYRYDLSDSNWVMGEKYVYAITFTVNEITVAPTVKEYVNGTVSDLTPTELK